MAKPLIQDKLVGTIQNATCVKIYSILRYVKRVSSIFQVSSMPVPPLNYVKLYTDENVKAGRAPR